jgi:phosphatidylinositol 4-kinase A
MITVISGVEASKQSQHYHRFEELCVKGFLACRPYAEDIIRCVILMLDSGLPCFKGMTTIKNLRDRFVLDKNERVAGDYMLGLIRTSHENMRTVLYDQFQYATNGIPY